MILDISKSHLVLLVSALNGAIEYNEGLLNSQAINDVSDYEEHLLGLANFQGWLENEYKRIEKDYPDIVKYDEIAGRKRAK